MAKLVYQTNLEELRFEVWNERPEKSELFTVNQIHSNLVVNADFNQIETDGDAIITASQNKVLAIKTADCVPIALRGTSGVVLVHAGWKGVRDKILINEAISDLGITHALIGPHIRVENYEVGEEFKENFEQSTHFEEINGKICFNLTTSVYEQLSSTYPGIIIKDCELDTFTEESLRSYRSGDKIERNWNILKYN